MRCYAQTLKLTPVSSSEDSPTNTKSPGPVITQLDDKDISTFPTGRPLDDQPDYTVCKHCKKPVTKPAAVTHIKACLKAKSDKAKERKKAKEAAAAAERGGKDKDGSAVTVAGEKPGGEDAEGSVVGDAPVGPKKGAKKMARKEGDAAKSKKRKADGGFWCWSPGVGIWTHAVGCYRTKAAEGAEGEEEKRETGEN